MITGANIRKGVILPMILVAIVILSTVGVATLSIGAHSRHRAIRTADEIASRTAADAGMRRALYELSHKYVDPMWDRSSIAVQNIPLPGTSSTFSYTITPRESGYTVASVGRTKNTERTVHSHIAEKTTAKGSFWTGLGVSSKIEFGNNASFRVWSSGSSAILRTNSDANNSIRIRNNSILPAGFDILLPHGSDPGRVISLGNNSRIDGDIDFGDPIDYPSVIPPSGGDFEGTPRTVISAGTLSQSGKYAGISIGHNQTLYVTGNVTIYVTGNISIGNNSKIIVASGGSLTAYTDGNVDIGNNSQIISANSDPIIQAKSIKLLGTDTCTSIVLANIGNNSNFHGALYAPEARVSAGNNATILGAWVAKESYMGNSATFIYVADLISEIVPGLDANEEASVVSLKLERWWE